MRSSFEPKHLQRAKETLQKQLQVVEESVAQKEPKQVPIKVDETSLLQKIKRFFRRFIS
ncbi:MAG: hypothetical protein L3J47_10370 [Sulfurovum sp.]|nr:hypothetical protein [Sulfurovum sp.]